MNQRTMYHIMYDNLKKRVIKRCSAPAVNKCDVEERLHYRRIQEAQAALRELLRIDASSSFASSSLSENSYVNKDNMNGKYSTVSAESPDKSVSKPLGPPKFHIKEDGETGRCFAEILDCPLGGEHFPTEAEARAYFEEKIGAFIPPPKMRKPSVKDWLTNPLDSLLGLDMDELENNTRKRVYRQDVSWEVFKLAHKHYREELETTKDTRLLRREAQRIFDHINSITDRTELYKKMDLADVGDDYETKNFPFRKGRHATARLKTIISNANVDTKLLKSLSKSILDMKNAQSYGDLVPVMGAIIKNKNTDRDTILSLFEEMNEMTSFGHVEALSRRDDVNDILKENFSLSEKPSMRLLVLSEVERAYKDENSKVNFTSDDLKRFKSNEEKFFGDPDSPSHSPQVSKLLSSLIARKEVEEEILLRKW